MARSARKASTSSGSGGGGGFCFFGIDSSDSSTACRLLLLAGRGSSFSSCFLKVSLRSCCAFSLKNPFGFLACRADLLHPPEIERDGLDLGEALAIVLEVCVKGMVKHALDSLEK